MIGGYYYVTQTESIAVARRFKPNDTIWSRVITKFIGALTFGLLTRSLNEKVQVS